MSSAVPRLSPLLAAVPALALACSGSGGPGVQPAPLLTNLGLVATASELAADGDLLLVAAREFQAGGRDLNGDGDAFDLVVFLVDLASGTARNTGLALDSNGSRMATVRGDLALFGASEAQSGGRDLNGDGDANDTVAFVHDRRDGSTRGLGLALSVVAGAEPALGGDLAAFAVSEADQGADLDGDGRRTGNVLHVYESGTRALVNTGLEAPSRLFLESGSVAFFRDERDGDRNGDGDQLDRFVLGVHDLATRTTRDSRLATDGAAPVFAGGTWLVAVPEAAQGRDLDGDGRLESFVAHAFLGGTGEVRNLGVACVDVPCAQASPTGRAVFALRTLVPQGASAGAGATDTSGIEVALHLYDPALDRLMSLGLAAFSPPLFAGGALAFLADEVAQGVDLDGDGDALDSVAFLVNPATGLTTNLGLEALALRGSRDFLLLARQESQADEDWNGDGDLLDVVVHVLDPRTETSINTRLASADVFGASADQVLLYVDEGAQGLDLNGDRDRNDQVFVLFDLATRKARSLNLAGAFDEQRFGMLNENGRLLVLANERAQGRDLDGDGDLADDVLFRGR